MTDRAQQEAAARLETVENRLVALQELGIDTAFLHNQLIFARDLLARERYGDVSSLADELLALAGNMAKGGSGGGQPAPAPVTRPVPAQGHGSAGRRRSVEVGLHTLLDQVGDAVEKALTEKMGHREDDTERIKRAVSEILEAQQTAPDETQRIERAVQSVLAQQAPDAGVTARIQKAVAEAVPVPTAQEGVTGRIERAVSSAMGKPDGGGNLMSRIEKLHAEMAQLRERLHPHAEEEGQTARIEQVISKAMAGQADAQQEHLAQAVGQAVDQALQQRLQQHDDSMAQQLSQAVAAAFREHAAEDHQQFADQIADGLEQALQQQRPVTVHELSDQVAAVISGVMGDQGPVHDLTGRIQRAISSAVHDEVPTALFHVSSSVHKAVAESVAVGTEHQLSRCLSRNEDAGAIAGRILDDVMVRMGERVDVEIGERLRQVFQERFAEVVGQLEHAFGSHLQQQAPALERDLEQLTDRIRQQGPAADEAGELLAQEVSALVQQHGTDQGEMQQLRDRLRQQVETGIATLDSQTQKYLRVNEDIADAIEELIDAMLGTVTGVLSRRLTKRMTARLLRDSQADTALEPGAAPATAMPPSVSDDGSSGLRPVTDRLAGKPLEANEVVTGATVAVPQVAPAAGDETNEDNEDSRLTEPVAHEDLSEQVTFGDGEKEIDDQIETAVEEDDDDESALLDNLLRELVDHDTEDEADGGTTQDRAASNDEVSQAQRDRLYELTQESMPESAPGRVQVLEDLSKLRGRSGDTVQLIREALARGERRMTTPYQAGQAGDQGALPDEDSGDGFEPSVMQGSSKVLKAAVDQVITDRLGASGEESGIQAMITAEVHRQMVEQGLDGPTKRMPPPADATVLRHQLRSLLPELFRDETIKQHLFAALALEMITNPGVLGELAGIHSFIREEIAKATSSTSV